MKVNFSYIAFPESAMINAAIQHVNYGRPLTPMHAGSYINIRVPKMHVSFGSLWANVPDLLTLNSSKQRITTKSFPCWTYPSYNIAGALQGHPNVRGRIPSVWMLRLVRWRRVNIWPQPLQRDLLPPWDTPVWCNPHPTSWNVKYLLLLFLKDMIQLALNWLVHPRAGSQFPKAEYHQQSYFPLWIRIVVNDWKQ